MALLWSGTWPESLQAHKTPLSLSSCSLTLAESLVVPCDSSVALLQPRTRHESSPAHNTLLSLPLSFLTQTESLAAPNDSW